MLRIAGRLSKRNCLTASISMLIPSFSFGLSLLFLIYSTSVVQALPVPALTSLLRRGGSEVCRGTKLRTGTHRETCTANNAYAKSYRWNGDNLETLKILSVTSQDQCGESISANEKQVIFY